MPMFHSNAIMAGWAAGPGRRSHDRPGTAVLGLAASSPTCVGSARRTRTTSASRWPTSWPRPNSRTTPTTRCASCSATRRTSGDIAEFARRFGCTVVDAYGSTENAVIVQRRPGHAAGRARPAARRREGARPETVTETPDAEFDADGRLTNADDGDRRAGQHRRRRRVRRLLQGRGAEAERMRGGMYWSGDLAYRDADGFIYFAGRTGDWLRVDGENLAAAPIERILLRHPGVSEAAVYAVPDRESATRSMAALVLRGPLDPDGLVDVPGRAGRPRRPRRGRRTCGSSTHCRGPRPTRCSSASWSAEGPASGDGCCGAPARPDVRRPRGSPAVIICDSRRLRFVHVQKTGGSAVPAAQGRAPDDGDPHHRQAARAARPEPPRAGAADTGSSASSGTRGTGWSRGGT